MRRIPLLQSRVVVGSKAAPGLDVRRSGQLLKTFEGERGHSAEEAPSGVQPCAHVVHRLRERRPHVHVPARLQRHDQRPQPTPLLSFGVRHRPDQPEVDLRLLPG